MSRAPIPRNKRSRQTLQEKNDSRSSKSGLYSTRLCLNKPAIQALGMATRSWIWSTAITASNEFRLGRTSPTQEIVSLTFQATCRRSSYKAALRGLCTALAQNRDLSALSAGMMLHALLAVAACAPRTPNAPLPLPCNKRNATVPKVPCSRCDEPFSSLLGRLCATRCRRRRRARGRCTSSPWTRAVRRG